jgi:glyoxylase I family protein
MKLASTGLAHIGVRVTDLARTRNFYVDKLGFVPLVDLPDRLICDAYGLTIAFIGRAPQTRADDHFDPFRVGLDHIALEITSTDELGRMKQDLDLAGVRNNGIELNSLTNTNYISFYDPDGIAWELYSTPRR